MHRVLLRHRKLISLSVLSCTTLAIATTAMSSSTSTPQPSSLPHKESSLPAPRPYHPRHTTFPYTSSDFLRQDPDPDTDFYSSPRLVTHIDDHAIACLRSYYSTVLPRKGRILDFCSSWVSHYPKEVEEAAKKGDVTVTGMGMSRYELERNGVLKERVVRDLNERPEIVAPRTASSAGGGEGVGEGKRGEEGQDDLYDAATCVVSIDYLTQPVAVLASLRERMRVGGSVHLAVSNRCFPTKAVARWLRVGEEERLQMVGDFLWFAGWREVEILVLSNGRMEDEGEGSVGGISGFMRSLGLMGGGCDPLWVVRGRKVEGDGDGDGGQKRM